MLGLSLIAVLFFFVKLSYSVLLNQMTWFVIAISVWVIFTGGLVYSMLNTMPWFKFERNEFGQVVIAEYFMRGQRGQWAGEGYIASVLCTVIGLCYLGLCNIEKYFVDKNSQRLAVMALLVSLYIMQMMYVAIYRFKSPWYNPVFSPPDYYLRGSFLEDQGNNI
jgi:amino acid transporter